MTQITKETVTQNNGDSTVKIAPVKMEATPLQTIGYLIYFLFGTLDVLLTFRFILKLAGASPGSYFVSLIYSITGFLTLPFRGIFRSAVTDGIETSSVFEPSTLIAIIVYAVLAWGIVKFLSVASGEKQEND